MKKILFAALFLIMISCNDATDDSGKNRPKSQTASSEVDNNSTDIEPVEEAETAPPVLETDPGNNEPEDPGFVQPPDYPTETFSDEDSPRRLNIDSITSYTPWGYDKPENSERLYPVVVIGRHNESRFFTQDTKQRFPSFYILYPHSNETDGANLADYINTLLIDSNSLRIDTNRIYLTGWSQGGSGGYNLMRGFLSKGMYFAAMIRVAGKSQTSLPDQIVAKTSVWYHVGLSDSTLIKNTSATAYTFMKNHTYNSAATETIVNDTLVNTQDGTTTSFARTTKTLIKNSLEIMKLSEYTGMGHVPGPPYSDPELFNWLFSQSLNRR